MDEFLDLDELEPDVLEFFQEINLEEQESIIDFLNLIADIQKATPEEVLLNIIDNLDEENTNDEPSEYLEELRRIAEE